MAVSLPIFILYFISGSTWGWSQDCGFPTFLAGGDAQGLRLTASRPCVNHWLAEGHELKYHIIRKLLFQNTLTVTKHYQPNLERLSPGTWSGINLVSYSIVQSIHCSVERHQKKKKEEKVPDMVPALKGNIISRGRKDSSSNLLLHNNLLQTSVAENCHFIDRNSVGQKLKQDS